MNNVMTVNGLSAVIHTPQALEGDDLHSLPPGAPRPAHVVDEYPKCPENWMNGSDKASSYFVPVEAGKGMWFDFTMNQGHAHEVAVVISVQGINPLTGKKMTALNLEQYKKQCPIHNVDFQQDRFCPECEYKWPAQSYISTTTGQTLWLDGFRNEQGEVRQYIISEEEMQRGVAQQMIGEDRVWAIGFAFYLSKEAKPKPVYRERRLYSMGAGGGTMAKCCSFNGDADTLSYAADELGLESMDVQERGATRSVSAKRAATKKLEVGAGARIDQEIGVDPKDIDFWEEEPAGMIYVNYINPELCQQILEGGKREETKEGYLEWR